MTCYYAIISYHHHHHHHHHNHHLANMDLGHLLTRSVLTRLEVSVMVSAGFFFLLVCRFLVLSVIYVGAFCLHVATIFLCIPEFCRNPELYLVLLQSPCFL